MSRLVHAAPAEHFTGDRADDDPARWLVGFAKVAVGASDRVTLPVALDPRAYRMWDDASPNGVDLLGHIELAIGASSRDLPIVLPVERWACRNSPPIIRCADADVSGIDLAHKPSHRLLE